MVWRKLKKLFGGGEPPSTTSGEPPSAGGGDPPSPPKIRWLADDDNPFGVPVLDLRPYALGFVSTSSDPQMAANAMSYRSDDGAAFVAQAPPSSRTVDCALRFRIDRVLLEGTLFQPAVMEDKWALYHRDGRILCIRSWQRRVMIR